MLNISPIFFRIHRSLTYSIVTFTVDPDPTLSPNSVATLGVLTAGVNAWWSFEVVSYVRGTFVFLAAQKLFHLPLLREVSHETVARRPLAQPSRQTALINFGLVRSLSLWCGANFEVAREALSALSTCVKFPSLWHGSHFDIQGILYRDLAKRPFIGSLYRYLATRRLVEILYRDLLWRPLTEIFCGDLL